MSQYKDLGEFLYNGLVHFARVPYSTIIHEGTAELLKRGLVQKSQAPQAAILRVEAYEVTEAGWAKLEEIDVDFARALKRAQNR